MYVVSLNIYFNIYSSVSVVFSVNLRDQDVPFYVICSD